ncbi:tripartite tricarboxylate transporter substrate-binding protein [Roseomonas chloroacetimidivorans]|uniref:tripartite tricarboxylate transporter substrate-binding protein n=1 Tax=Roseomonas chloroacetimidivorans TaxID=1766656 RepID=UPI003C70945E
MKARAGIELLHVPYRGAGQAAGALLAGDTDLLITGLIEALPHVKEGRMRAIAVTPGGRSPALPGTPAVAKAVPGYDLPIWYAVLAPRGTPPDVVNLLTGEMAPLRARTPLAARIGASGATLLLDGPSPLARRLEREVALWKEVLPAAGIEPK